MYLPDDLKEVSECGVRESLTGIQRKRRTRSATKLKTNVCGGRVFWRKKKMISSESNSFPQDRRGRLLGIGLRVRGCAFSF